MKWSTLVAIAITAIAVIVFAITFSRATVYSSPDEISSVPYDAAKAGAPLQLRIPTLSVSAAVQAVGVAKSGNMAVPTNYTDVGWYRGGTLPGAIGSAVMDGHVDNGLGAPAVFARIGELHEGDSIFVDTASGTLRFVVEEVVTYPRDKVPLEHLFNRANAARLNLVTCEGEWLADKKTYDHRVVVYTVLQP